MPNQPAAATRSGISAGGSTPRPSIATRCSPTRNPGTRLPRRTAETDLSLQVVDEPAPLPLPAFPLAHAPATTSRRRRMLITAGLTLLAALGTGIVVMSLWLLTLAPR